MALYYSHDTYENRDALTSQISSWSPYMDNGGTLIACKGDDFVMIVSDTRLAYGYTIATRNFQRYSQLTEKVYIVSCGMQAEIVALHRQLKLRVAAYEEEHEKTPSVDALSQLLSVILYHKRFFPIYAFNVLVGIDDEGTPKVFRYDAVGNFNSESYGMAGAGAIMASSILDSYYLQFNQQINRGFPSKKTLKQIMLSTIKDISERNVTTGDFAEFVCIDKSGVEVERVYIRQD